jgi:3-hydroxyacyl-CoA dehydrogenase
LKKLVEEKRLGFKSGKGFQEWPEDKASESRKRLQKYLMGVIKEGVKA